MKIVHFLSRVRLADGGVVRAVLDLCDALAKGGHSVTLLTWDATDAPEAWKAPGGAVEVVRITPARGPLARFTPESAASARRAIEGAEALHLHVVWDPACARLAGMARRAGVPYVVSTHGMLDEWSMAQKTVKKRAYLAIAGRRMLRGAGAVHCTAEAERAQGVKWHGNPRTRVVPLILDVREYVDLPGSDVARAAFPALDTGRAILLFLSRLHEKKRPELVIEAAKALRSRGREVEVALAGPADDAMRRSLERAAADAGLADRVHLLGMVSGREKVSLYEWASVFVLPTSQENFGFVLIESLAAGTPAVTTKGVDIWPELQDSGGVEVVDPATPDGLAGAIERVLARRREMRDAGRAWALREFRGDSIVARYSAMYEEAVSA